MAMGWQKLIPSDECFHGQEAYRIDAYSEFLPAPRVGWKPYGDHEPDPELVHEDDPFGWQTSEFEEARELETGLVQVGGHLLGKLAHLLEGRPHPGIHKLDLLNNPYWPPELAARPGLPHERCVTLLPLALSRTQDDKGRVRWTLFGNSEQGPGKAFWKSFYTTPKKETPAEDAVAFFCRLLHLVYGENVEGASGLRKAGFRILPDEKPLLDVWAETLPGWTSEFLHSDRPSRELPKYLLTFRPFGRLPAAVQKAYLAGTLCLLPSPVSLIFWGMPGYLQLQQELPFALQIPLQLGIPRHRGPEGVRIPQSGFLHEATAERPHPHAHAPPITNHYQRTNRWDKVHRDQDELTDLSSADRLVRVLFCADPGDVQLYDKPLARNVQLWTEGHKLLLNGPSATPEQIQRAAEVVEGGGLFGYRFQFPAMRVGRHEIYWHRPLVAYRDAAGQPHVLPEAPLGYLTAYDADKPRLDRPIELWPRILKRTLPLAVLNLHPPGTGRTITPAVRSVNKLLDAYQKRGERPLPRTLARQLLMPHCGPTLEGWLGSLGDEELVTAIRGLIEPEGVTTLPRRRGAAVPDSLTYRRSATRAFELNYWKTIAALSEGTFLNKNNADCVLCAVTQKALTYHERQLEGLGDFLLRHYKSKIAAAGMAGKAHAGSLPFQWRTNFNYRWMGGWLKNQTEPAERNLLMLIPGRDRSRAVIMSDHYDTAYETDKYDVTCGGTGARISACGADDNHSATAAMMLAAPIFMEMSKRGTLGCDVWLIHLTGEEFPADCLGARALTQRLVEGRLELCLPDGKTKDLSRVQVKGLYVSDMIAHNRDHGRDVFQISPGVDPAAFWLAEQAHVATEVWNASVPVWNQQPDRAGKERGRRSPHGGAIPEIAPYLHLSGEVRTHVDPRSTVYNTDAQIFSDAGVPCVLFMENYDINRSGYHDTHDTMANIDLEYGAAVCAITIESVARAATMERT